VSDANWANMERCDQSIQSQTTGYRWDSAPACDYHNATCRIKFSLYDQEMPCSVRRKGSYSLAAMGATPSLKVKLANEWMGMKKFTFNAMKQDRGYLRERMAYAMYRMAGVTAPRANHASVDFRKSSSQARDRMYLNLEGYNDRRFWEDRGAGAENGTVWELQGPLPIWHPLAYNGQWRPFPKWGGMAGLESLWCKEGCEGSPEARLKELLSVNQPSSGSESLARLWGKLDKDQFLRLMSVDRIITHWDGPAKNNNMWLWRDSTGMFFMLPWGLDQTFKSDTIHDTGPQPSMLKACLQNTDCAKDYRDVFLQTAKALGAQETALLSLANLAAKQAGKASSYGLSTSHENIYGIITALNYTAFPLTRPPTTTGSGLCATNGVKTGSVTKQVCTNTPDVCEVYIKKGNENGVANIKTCRQYCNAYGIDCMAQHKDKNGCGRGSKYNSCDVEDDTSDHICQCGKA